MQGTVPEVSGSSSRPRREERAPSPTGTEVPHRPQIVLHLPKGAHAAQDRQHSRKRGGVAQRPRCLARLGIGPSQYLRRLLRKVRERAAPEGFHHHHGNAPLGEEGVLAFCVEVLPVQVIHLQLTEIPLPFVDDPRDMSGGVVYGESHITDVAASFFFRRNS